MPWQTSEGCGKLLGGFWEPFGTVLGGFWELLTAFGRLPGKYFLKFKIFSLEFKTLFLFFLVRRFGLQR